jgi:hypothetical protein
VDVPEGVRASEVLAQALRVPSEAQAWLTRVVCPAGVVASIEKAIWSVVEAPAARPGRAIAQVDGALRVGEQIHPEEPPAIHVVPAGMVSVTVEGPSF